MANRLADETSPYLRQHADNPVDWYPWGEEALARAREENRPILLSIGYSACHWCHVMAHESFEDPAIAALMNELFVNIKVDREERPDLDQIYQLAHAMLSRRSGGWPLTVFLTPDQSPFFAGTYFPKTGRHGLPGLADLLVRVERAYRDQGEAIAAQSERLREALAGTNPEKVADAPLSEAAMPAAIGALKAGFDEAHGGFGGPPKFPHPTELALCLRRHATAGDAEALAMARLTLSRMADGGIFDHVGGGFCRYSVDGRWTIPHFEKMLYDNAQLLPLYADAWRLTGDAAYSSTARAVARWAIEEMRGREGGFHSSVDADSEGEEGRYYVWTPDEVRSLLGADEYEVAAPHFGLDGPPNFEGRAWHLRVERPLAEVATAAGIDLAQARARLDSARAKLRAHRAKRVPPGRDDKVLASWNALMTAGLARAARVLGEPAWSQAARGALDFIRRELWRDGRLQATWHEGRARFAAYLDDYAFLLEALLESMQTDFRIADFAWALEVADAMLARFEDRNEGGFFFTAHDHEKLIHRAKNGHDNATPSGNGIAARVLIELGHLTGDLRYLDAARRTLELFAPAFSRHPEGFSSMLSALDEHLFAPSIVLLRGDPATTAAWARALGTRYAPRRLVLDLGTGPVPGPLEKPGKATGSASAWLCTGSRCLAPVGRLDELEALLAEASEAT